jgi:hypothetical protein
MVRVVSWNAHALCHQALVTGRVCLPKAAQTPFTGQGPNIGETMNMFKLAAVGGLIAALLGCGGPVGGSASSGDLGGNAVIRELTAAEPDTDTEETDDTDEERVTTTCFRDRDGDQFGSTERVEVEGLSCPGDGAVANDDDCDDTRGDIKPGAAEIDDGSDNNCNGQIDEGLDDRTTLCYIDTDNDGYGRSTRVEISGGDCDVQGYSDRDGDCNDGQPGIRPGAVEVANGVDDNCNGQIDEGTDTDEVWCYDDGDDDGYGDDGVSRQQYSGDECPAGTSDNNDDCDDTRAAVNPDRVEVCDNGRDDDCDGDEDSADSDCDLDQETISCYIDRDGDGFGDEDASARSFDVDPGTECDELTESDDFVDNNDDCDDGDDSIHSGCGTVDPDDGTIEFCWNGSGIDDVEIERMQLVVFNEGDDGADGSAESVVQTSGLNDSSDCISTQGIFQVGDVACVNVTFTHNDSGVLEDPSDANTWYLAGCDGAPCDPVVTGIPSINGEQPSLNNVYSDEYRTSGSRLSYDGVPEDSTPTAGRWFWATNWNGRGVDLCVQMTDVLFDN